jgi:hypothetical protein
MVKHSGIHCYIDANVFLSFYDFTNDNINHLSELVKYIQSGALTVYLPIMTKMEYLRNRENKIATCLRTFEAERIPAGLPRLAEGYGEFAEYQALREGMAKAKDALIKQIRSDARATTLRADKLIQDIFGQCNEIPHAEQHLRQAVLRRDLHEPPGKSNSMGDQIAWECLKAAVPDEVDIHIVSKDADWTSALDSKLASNPIQNEWKAAKRATVFTHKSLKDFLDVANLGITLQADQERYELVSSLYDSPSYASTHRLVESLSWHDDFTAEETELLCSAALTNTQVSDIIEDEDVRHFFEQLLEKNSNALHKDMKDALARRLNAE